MPERVVPAAWEALPDRVRAAMLACGEESWSDIYRGVATKNKTWRPLRPPVLTRADYREITDLTAWLGDLILAACLRRASTAGELRRLLGVPEGYVEFLDGAEPLTPELLVAMRPDVLLSGGVPRFVECNIDSALGGAFDSDGIAHRFLAAYREMGIADAVGITDAGSAVDARFHAMREQLDLPDGSTSLVLFHMGSDYPDTQDGHTLIRLLEPVRDRGREAGLEVVVRPLEWLTLDAGNRLLAGDVVLDSVLRMFIPQEVPHGAGFDALATALGKRTVKMFTSTAAWLLANKTTFAWLWQDVDELSTPDAELLRRHVPRTELLDDTTASSAIERRASLVLKPTGTYGGSGVVLGHDVDDATWRKAVEAGVATGGHIVQEYVAADWLDMHFVEMATGEVRRETVPYCVAPFLFGGKASGAYLRFAVPGAGSVVNLGQGALTSGLLLVD
ncbi:hypothetical protein [Actinophytocola sp.]|uniref:hypothetical protein n=1 Tax=Actinophytocola sp. TaxID=1872138 RepID=UPI003D6BEC52